MARFNFGQQFFRWVAATASQLDSAFDAVKDWVDNNLSVDSLLPRSVTRRHTAQPLIFAICDYEHNVENIGVGNPLVEVLFDHSAGGSHKVIVLGWAWYRRRSSNGQSGHTANADKTRIVWWDDIGGTWQTGVYGGSNTDWLTSHEETVWGTDQTMPAPLPGGSYTVGNLLFEYGGCQCIHTTMLQRSDFSTWPPGGEDVTKYGLFGQDSGATDPRAGKALIWLIAEDNGQ